MSDILLQSDPVGQFVLSWPLKTHHWESDEPISSFLDITVLVCYLYKGIGADPGVLARLNSSTLKCLIPDCRRAHTHTEWMELRWGYILFGQPLWKAARLWVKCESVFLTQKAAFHLELRAPDDCKLDVVSCKLDVSFLGVRRGPVLCFYVE